MELLSHITATNMGDSDDEKVETPTETPEEESTESTEKETE